MVDSSKEGWGAPCQGGGNLPIHFNAARVVCWSLYSKPPFDMEFDGEIKSVYYVIGSLQSQFILGFQVVEFCINKGSCSSIEDREFGIETLLDFVSFFC